MTEACYSAAKRIDPSRFKIDYKKGGKHGWILKSMLTIAFKNCLESDSTLSKKHIQLLADSYGGNAEDIKNVRLREKYNTSKMNISGVLRRYGAGSKKCRDIINDLPRSGRQSNYILHP